MADYNENHPVIVALREWTELAHKLATKPMLTPSELVRLAYKTVEVGSKTLPNNDYFLTLNASVSVAKRAAKLAGITNFTTPAADRYMFDVLFNDRQVTPASHCLAIFADKLADISNVYGVMGRVIWGPRGGDAREHSRAIRAAFRPEKIALIVAAGNNATL